jgi:hypothetical protein
MLCIDCSNYSDPFDAAKVREWKANGVGLVIVQSLDAARFPQSQTRRQLGALAEGGMPADIYVYPFFGNAPDDAERRAREASGLPYQDAWLDVEDVDPTQAAWLPSQREQRVAEWFAQLDPLSARPAGYYGGAWYHRPRLNNTPRFSDRRLWFADYASGRGVYVPFGGWQSWAIHQFQGTTSFCGVGGVDLNLLSEAEALRVVGTPDQPADIDIGWLEKKPAVVAAAGRQQERATQLLAEAGRKGAPRKTVIRRIAFGLAADAAVILE